MIICDVSSSHVHVSCDASERFHWLQQFNLSQSKNRKKKVSWPKES